MHSYKISIPCSKTTYPPPPFINRVQQEDYLANWNHIHHKGILVIVGVGVHIMRYQLFAVRISTEGKYIYISSYWDRQLINLKPSPPNYNFQVAKFEINHLFSNRHWFSKEYKF